MYSDESLKLQEEKKNQADVHLGRKDWSPIKENPNIQLRYFLCTKKNQWNDFLRVLKGKEKIAIEDFYTIAKYCSH